MIHVVVYQRFRPFVLRPHDGDCEQGAISIPNGGILPSCFIGEHGQKLNQTDTIVCQRHALTVRFAPSLVCADLAHPNLSRFRDEHEMLDDYISMWSTIIYRTPAHPRLPRSYHDLAAFAPLSTYAAWSESAQNVAYRSHDQHRAAVFGL